MLFTSKRIELFQSDYFDMWRGGSALVVLIAHAFQVFAPDQHRLFSTLAGYAVMAFFAISGFFIHKSLTRCFNGNFDWRSFLHARASRILPPFVACLLLTITLWNLAPFLFASGSHSFLTPIGNRTDFSLDGLWQTAIFLNGFPAPTLSANGPLWSLTYEVWYYVIAGLVAIGCTRKKTGLIAIPVIVALVSINKYFAIKALVWVGGFCISLMHSNQRLPRIPHAPIWILPLSLLFIVFLIPDAMLGRFNRFSELIFGAYMCYHMARILKQDTLPTTQLLVWSGKFSYTLYVFHFPILLFSYGISETSAILAVATSLLISATIGPSLERMFHKNRW